MHIQNYLQNTFSTGDCIYVLGITLNMWEMKIFHCTVIKGEEDTLKADCLSSEN